MRSSQDVVLLVAETINQVRRGQLHPKIANTVGYLASVQLRALEQGPVEERLSRLEATLGLKNGANASREEQSYANTELSVSTRATGAGGKNQVQV